MVLVTSLSINEWTRMTHFIQHWINKKLLSAAEILYVFILAPLLLCNEASYWGLQAASSLCATEEYISPDCKKENMDCAG